LENGDWPGPAPIGYLNDRANKKIIKDPVRFPFFRRLWNLFLSGCYSVPQLVEIADKNLSLRTVKRKRTGGTPISRSNMYALLANPFYYGVMRRNKSLYKGNHKSMISKAEFDRVQNLLGRTNGKKLQKHHFAFTGGLIHCSECGCAITAEAHTNKYGYHYIYYRCSKKSKTIKCKQPYIKLEDLQKQMVSFLSQLQIPKKSLKWALQYVKRWDEEQNEVTDKSQQCADKALKDTEKQLDELTSLRIREMINDDEFVKSRDKILSEKEKLSQILNNTCTNELRLESFQNVLHFARNAKFWFKKATDIQKRKIMEITCSNLELKDKNLLILAKKPFLFINERTDNPSWWSIVDDVRTFLTTESIVPQIAVDIKNLIEKLGIK